MPVISLSISLIFKVICEVALISIPYLNIAGAVISNVVCYFVSSAINIVFIKKQIKLNFILYNTIVCPCLCTIFACLLVFALKNLFALIMSANWAVLLALVVGAISYFVLIFVLKGFSDDEKKSLFKFDKFKNKINKKQSVKV